MHEMTDTTLQDLYDSEINFEISCFWDGGFLVRLGDKMNGFKTEMTVRTYSDAVGQLRTLAILHFPSSAFAKKYDGVQVESPPLVPEGFDTDVYVVLEEFLNIGRAYREVDEEAADRETLIRDLISGQYAHPIRIVAFNTAKGWSRDVSEEIAREIADRASAKGDELTGPVQTFVEYELERAGRQRTLERLRVA
jgi:hypothetical protein